MKPARIFLILFTILAIAGLGVVCFGVLYALVAYPPPKGQLWAYPMWFFYFLCFLCASLAWRWNTLAMNLVIAGAILVAEGISVCGVGFDMVKDPVAGIIHAVILACGLTAAAGYFGLRHIRERTTLDGFDMLPEHEEAKRDE